MQTLSKDIMLAELRARVARLEGGDARFAPAPAPVKPYATPDRPGAHVTPGADGFARPLPLGVAEIDRRLPGRGLQPGRLHEVVGCLDGAGTGFVVHLLRRLMDRGREDDAGFNGAGGPVLWCAPQATLYAPGLACRGLDVDRLVCVVASRRDDRLWAMEEALRCPGVAAVVGELRERETIDLTASRRLQLAAGQGGALALLLYPPPLGARAAGVHRLGGRRLSAGAKQAGAEADAWDDRGAAPTGADGAGAGAAGGDGSEADTDGWDAPALDVPALGASAAVTRWHVRPLPLLPADAGGDAGAGQDDDMGRRARWRLTLLRSRAGARHAWTVEVDHATGDLALAAPLRDRSRAAAGRAVA